jgi:hypothetical protein
VVNEKYSISYGILEKKKRFITMTSSVEGRVCEGSQT